jgi:hypothetical protein
LTSRNGRPRRRSLRRSRKLYGPGGGCRPRPLEACHIPAVGRARPTPSKRLSAARFFVGYGRPRSSSRGCGGPGRCPGRALRHWRIELSASSIGDGDRSVSRLTPSWASASLLSGIDVQSSTGDGFWHRCAADHLRHTHDSGTAKRLLRGVVPTQERSALKTSSHRIHPIGLAPQTPDQRKRWSRARLWAWLDLNQRPHPYQRSTAERRANQPLRWSRYSVSPTRMGNLSVQPSVLATLFCPGPTHGVHLRMVPGPGERAGGRRGIEKPVEGSMRLEPSG